MRERIVCAAIHNPDEKNLIGEPLIYCGLRHSDIEMQSMLVSRNPSHQGFLTTTGRFVDRIEALHIAIDSKQVDHCKVIKGGFLYSVDLY